MKSACLLPYCPLPVNSGARAVFNKHLEILNKQGECRILSKLSRPVGFGWQNEHIKALKNRGFLLSFDPTTVVSRPLKIYGMIYAIIFKILKAEKAFGHSNPYHRYAFDQHWVYETSKGLNLCEIHYSYWARIQTVCPKVVVVHDLWSTFMWGGDKTETKELGEADLIVTVSFSDYQTLVRRGLINVMWSPPVVKMQNFDDSTRIGIVGSNNRFNQEGIRWFLSSSKQITGPVHVYGGLGNSIIGKQGFKIQLDYQGVLAPYNECGIIAITTGQGTGVQIKAIEALASGRAIVARKDAMRGLPCEEIGWIEVDSADEMKQTLNQLNRDKVKRRQAMEQAADYYRKYLSAEKIETELVSAYRRLQS